MDKLRVIVADDERPARMFLKNLLADFDDVELIGEAENGADAAQIIKQLQPDLALLDLQMPALSGLEAVRMLPKDELPLIAFVTAYDEYAVQAFGIDALDYLLKPVEKSRLRETIQRAFKRLNQFDTSLLPEDSARQISTTKEKRKSETIERIPVKMRNEIILVSVREIASIVADGELLKITNFRNKVFVINHRLKDLEAKLPAEKFLRISRGAIINIEMISKISPLPGGIYQLLLKNGQKINSSRLQSSKIRESFLKF